MARAVNVSQQDTKDSKGSGFDPIAPGTYNVTIFDFEIGQYKAGTANAGRDFLNVQFRISDGQKGANRRLFERIGDFARWAPKDGATEGKVNFTFFGFYRALGVDFDGVDGDVELPDYEDLKGAALAVKVAIENDDYRYGLALSEWKQNKDKANDPEAFEVKNPRPEPSDFKRNVIKDFLPEQDVDDLGADDVAVDDDDDEFDL